MTFSLPLSSAPSRTAFQVLHILKRTSFTNYNFKVHFRDLKFESQRTSYKNDNFKVHLTDGGVSTPECVVMAPANEANELDTVLLLGRVGGFEEQPFSKSFRQFSLGTDWPIRSGRQEWRWWRISSLLALKEW